MDLTKIEKTIRENLDKKNYEPIVELLVSFSRDSSFYRESIMNIFNKLKPVVKYKINSEVKVNFNSIMFHRIKPYDLDLMQKVGILDEQDLITAKIVKIYPCSEYYKYEITIKTAITTIMNTNEHKESLAYGMMMESSVKGLNEEFPDY